MSRPRAGGGEGVIRVYRKRGGCADQEGSSSLDLVQACTAPWPNQEALQFIAPTGPVLPALPACVSVMCDGSLLHLIELVW